MEKNNILNWLASGWYIKLFAVITAVLLWLYVYNIERTTEKISITIKFRNPPPETELYTIFNFKKEQTVKAEISGKKSVVKQLINHNFMGFVDLSLANSDRKEYDIQVEIPTLAKAKVKVVLDKKTIKIPFQKIIDSTFDIKLNTKIPKQFRVNIEPQSVKFRGPEEEIKKIKGMITEPFTVNYETSYEEIDYFIIFEDNKKKRKLRYNQLPKIINPISLKKLPKKIIYSVSIIEKKIRISNTEVQINDVEIIDPNISSYLILVEKNLKLNYIIYKGPAQAINKIQENDVRAYINVGNISKPGTYTIKVIPQEIEELKVVKMSPNKLKVTLKKKVK